MGRALAVSPRATNGLESIPEPPWHLCRSEREWVDELARLFDNPEATAEAGRTSRRWAEQHCTWARAAEIAEAAILAAIERRRTAP